MRFARSFVAAVVLLVVAGPPAGAWPTTSGPLVARSVRCDDDRGPSGSLMWNCDSWFELLPAETNALEDYSVYWAVVGIDPGLGWCATHLEFAIELPSSARVVSAVPERGGVVHREGSVKTELLVDAEGTAPVPGEIYENATARRGRTVVRWGLRGYAYRWTGRSPRELYSVIGLQIAGRRIPPQLLNLSLEGMRWDVETCEPASARGGR